MNILKINNMLSLRLKLIAESVPKNCNVVDVGTDHGYLAIYLKNSGIANNVFACDINKAPLMSAAKNAEKYNAKINLCLCNGLDGIAPQSVDVIIIAGMGAEVICGIIERAKWLKSSNKLLIFQPMNSPELLREYLGKNGFTLKTEQAVLDANRVYSVITAVFSGEINNDVNSYYSGLLSGKNQADRMFLQKQYNRIKTQASDIKNIPEKHEEYLKLSKIAVHLKHHMEEI